MAGFARAEDHIALTVGFIMLSILSGACASDLLLCTSAMAIGAPEIFAVQEMP